ncbi:putative transcription factor bHLH107 [Eucalyptus grandis]|nr:putative transcription factor bHLH107 [Eucalyptus grandis]
MYAIGSGATPMDSRPLGPGIPHAGPARPCQEPPTASVNSIDSADPSLSHMMRKLSMTASRSHKEAERRRRQRINAHLSTLRSLLPSTSKMDKASLLAQVVHRVKKLRCQVADVARRDGPACLCPELPGPLPSESDEASLSRCSGEEGLVEATVCCDDRPSLNRDLGQVVRAFGARVVRAEMATLAGRTRCVLRIKWAGRESEFGGLKRALRMVMENRALDCGPDRVAVGDKRTRAYSSIDTGVDDRL